MKTLKIGVILLALLLAAMAMVPMVSAAEPVSPAFTTAITNGTSHNMPQHYLPQDYLKDSKPTQWLPESDMINIVISQKSLEKFNQKTQSGIINIPISYLDLKTTFLNTTENPSVYIESTIGQNEKIALVRMPRQMYELFIENSKGGYISLPADYFVRYYTNTDDLKSHTKIDEDSVQITPSSEYPVPALEMGSNNTLKSSLNSERTIASPSSANTGRVSPLTTLGTYDQWARTERISSTNYYYCIGQINPYSWYLGGTGADLFQLLAEREYAFDNNEAMEIVAQFYDRNAGAGIAIFPAFYHSNAQYPIEPTQWNVWSTPIYLSANALPHAYGYHVQITNSGQYIQVGFEDMNTLQWIKSYVASTESTASTFTELRGSSEYRQYNVPSTDTFSEITNPVIDEWARDTNDIWHKPASVWQTPLVMDPVTSPGYVSVIPTVDGNGNILTVSSAQYP